jgi:hypothetical protein
LPLSNDARVRPDAPALDFAVTKPAPGRLVSHPICLASSESFMLAVYQTVKALSWLREDGL